MLIKGCWTWIMSGLKNHLVSEEVFGGFWRCISLTFPSFSSVSWSQTKKVHLKVN